MSELLCRASTPLTIAALIVVSVQSAMLANDFWNGFPSFLSADRALQRLFWIETIAKSTNGDEIIAALTGQGVLGDYFYQYVLLALGGRPGLVVAQILLCLWSVHAVYRTAWLLTQTAGMAAMCGLAYGLMPHTLVFAHQLSSEAVSVPLCVIAFSYAARYLTGSRRSDLAVSGLLFGMAILSRPILLLLPLALAPALWLRGRNGSSNGGVAAASLVAIALIPMLLWMAFVTAATGTIGIGREAPTLSSNLATKIGQLTLAKSEAERAAINQRYIRDGRTSVAGFLDFAAHYPLEVASSAAKDVMLFLGKSGATKVTMDYLNLAPDRQRIQRSHDNWRTVWQNEGTLSAFNFLLRNAGLGVLVIEGLGSILMLALSALTGIAAIALKNGALANAPERRAVLIAALLTVAVGIASTQSVDFFQTRHRYICEFAMLVLAGFAIQWLMQQRAALFARRHMARE